MDGHYLNKQDHHVKDTLIEIHVMIEQSLGSDPEGNIPYVIFISADDKMKIAVGEPNKPVGANVRTSSAALVRGAKRTSSKQ